MIPPKRFDIFPPDWDAQTVYARSDFTVRRFEKAKDGDIGSIAEFSGG